MPTKSWKKPSSCKLKSNFFFLTDWVAQTAQTEGFMLQNVAYRPTVYRTGAVTMKEGISFLSPVPYSPLLPSMTCFQCSVRRQRQCTAHCRANCLDTTGGFPTIRPHICRYLLTFSYRWYVDLEVSPTITNVIRVKKFIYRPCKRISTNFESET